MPQWLHRFAWLEVDYGDPAQFLVAIAAVWLVSTVPALSSHPHSARWAAFSAGSAVAIGLMLHLHGRSLLWPGLEGGCWVHTVEQGGLPDLACADIVPAHWDLTEFLPFLILWPLGSMAIAFLLGAGFTGICHLARSRRVTHEGT